MNYTKISSTYHPGSTVRMSKTNLYSFSLFNCPQFFLNNFKKKQKKNNTKIFNLKNFTGKSLTQNMMKLSALDSQHNLIFYK